MVELNKYKNINKALTDYIDSNSFKSKINIATNKNSFPIDYDNQSQTFIFKMAKDNFLKIGKTVFMNNNEKIYVSNGDIKECIAKAISNSYQKCFIIEHIEAFKILDKIIENGIKIASALEQKSRDKFSRWDYHITLVYIDGKPFVIEFDTVYRIDNNNEKHFRMARIYSFDEIKNKLF